ncbi:AAA family ATPase [Sphingomonas panni]
MKILAIRGKDLTSLAGEFEVDFDAEPLASAGIFAITGPTGAGKSTLLDAVCLALFNDVPRLGSVSSGHVGTFGGEMLTSSDPRALLRHRAGEGFAEVDFVGLDGSRYRARWSVRRARGRPDGALQQVVQTLVNLDTGDAMGGTRTETLAEIRRLIGLTAHQFGRAVMLAQGEFNAFIDADANTRAELLEKLTGTQLYARLGAAARLRADSLRQGITAIEVRISAQNGLDDIARAVAEESLAEARRLHGAAAGDLAARARDRDWHVRAGELARLVEVADGERAASVERRSEAEPRRLDLARKRLAHSAVPTWRASADADAKVAETRARIEVLTAEADDTRARTAIATIAEADAVRGLAEAAAERDRLRPELETAQALDRQLADAEGKLVPLADARAAASAQAAASAGAHASVTAQRNEASGRRDALAEWLDGNQPREALFSRVDDLKADITDRAALAERVAGLDAARVSVGGLIEAARETRDQTATAAAAARDALAAAESASRDAEGAIPPPARRTRSK